MNLRLSYIFILSIILFSCSEDLDAVRTDLRLRNKGADMPVWVRGNLASGKLILFLHGGPGDCAMCYRYYLEPVEKDFAVAYWDQRVAGSSTGNVDVSTLTYAQFLEDTELVVKLLREQYPNTKLYLVGHSFGVELGWQFLTTSQNQEMVDGFVAINGTFSSYRWLHHMREFVISNSADNPEAKLFAEQNVVNPTEILSYDWTKLYRYMLDVGGNPVHVMSDTGFVLDYALNSPNLTFGQFANGKHFSNVTNTDGLTFEKGPLLSNISIPVGLFWGRKDGVIPYEIALETADLLTGTTARIVTFEGSWHEPFISENEAFINHLRSFLEEH